MTCEVAFELAELALVRYVHPGERSCQADEAEKPALTVQRWPGLRPPAGVAATASGAWPNKLVFRTAVKASGFLS